jgi:hypothetical protein
MQILINPTSATRCMAGQNESTDLVFPADDVIFERVRQLKQGWSESERSQRSVVGQARRDQLFALINDAFEDYSVGECPSSN